MSGLKLGGDNNSGWIHDNHIIYINHLTIKGGPGNYDVEYTPTFFQRMLSMFNLGPSKQEIEIMIRHKLLGETNDQHSKGV